MPKDKASKTPDPKVLKELLQNSELPFHEPFVDCLKVLGSMKDVASFADIWAQEAKNMRLVTVHFLVKFCSERKGFTGEQYDAFVEGLNIFPLFFLQCAQEMQKNKMAEKNPVDNGM